MSKKNKSYLDDPIYTPPEDEVPDPPTNGESKSVKLKSGGTLTLYATTKFMALTADDRAFVFELIDKLGAYETKTTTAALAKTPDLAPVV